jgi:S-phase kinase-associated protein 1
MVTLKSSDGEEFEVSEEVAMQCKAISPLIEDGWDQIPIPLYNVTAKILRKVIEYCEQHVNAAHALETEMKKAEEDSSTTPASSRMSAEELRNWDKQFVDVDQETLYELFMAADYLDINSLLHLACQKVADMIKGKSPNEIRQILHIKNDFTDEEEQRIFLEDRWASS